jgi:glycosyltransferase involved in cell wall biosynthesis
MSKECIWYISKYVVPARESTIGGRGYMMMRELAKKGYKCLVLASDSTEYCEVPDMPGAYFKESIDGLDFFWIRTLKYSGAKSLRRILSWLHFEWRLLLMPKSGLPKPDVIIVSSLSILTILNGLFLKRRFRCSLIFEIRDIWPLTLTEEGGFSKLNPFIYALSWVEKLGYRYSNKIVGTMPNLKEHVENVLGYERPVFCVPMGWSHDEIDDVLPLPREYQEKYLPDHPFVVVHAGAIGVTNALETFLECAESLAENPYVNFVIVGDGYLREEYQARYKHLENLIFAPKVPRKMVQSVLNRCDLLYFSVRSSEVWKYGMSLNKVVDYMLAGKPIVASYSGYPSMINEAKCGSFIEPENVSVLRDEIIRYAKLPEIEREQIGLRGREWILRNRSYSTLADTYRNIMFAE